MALNLLFHALSYLCLLHCSGSPWYNHTGWLGVKHQLTYLLTVLDTVWICPLCLYAEIYLWHAAAVTNTLSEDPQCVVISSVNMLVCFLAQEPSCLVSNSKPSSLPGGFVLSRIRPMLLWTTHTYHEIPREHDEDDIDDCFYVALFSALEQTQCTHMWFYMND